MNNNNEFNNEPKINEFNNEPKTNEFNNEPKTNEFNNEPKTNEFNNDNIQKEKVCFHDERENKDKKHKTGIVLAITLPIIMLILYIYPIIIGFFGIINMTYENFVYKNQDYQQTDSQRLNDYLQKKHSSKATDGTIYSFGN